MTPPSRKCCFLNQHDSGEVKFRAKLSHGTGPASTSIIAHGGRQDLCAPCPIERRRYPNPQLIRVVLAILCRKACSSTSDRSRSSTALLYPPTTRIGAETSGLSGT